MRRRLTIKLPLRGAPEYESPKKAGSHIYVPTHYHDHGELSGLLDDDHPQYLTEDRGAALFIDLLNDYTEKTTAENIGIGIGLFARKLGDKIQIKSLRAGNGVRLVDVGEYISIEVLAVPILYTDWRLTFEESEGW